MYLKNSVKKYTCYRCMYKALLLFFSVFFCTEIIIEMQFYNKKTQ